MLTPVLRRTLQSFNEFQYFFIAFLLTFFLLFTKVFNVRVSCKNIVFKFTLKIRSCEQHIVWNQLSTSIPGGPSTSSNNSDQFHLLNCTKMTICGSRTQGLCIDEYILIFRTSHNLTFVHVSSKNLNSSVHSGYLGQEQEYNYIPDAEIILE